MDLYGRRFYRIHDYDRLAPFFMTLVGASDVWLFVSSTGGLTAGRVEPNLALFPYYTDDKISESYGRTGGVILLRIHPSESQSVLWEPFTTVSRHADVVERSLYKDLAGTTLVFEEVRTDLGLCLRVTWQTSSRFGVVRSCELTNLGDTKRDVEVLDGFLNVLPAGVETNTQNQLSNLLDAYKRSEVDEGSGLAMFWLSSRLTDLAEPSESLRANVAWQVGLSKVGHHLTARAVEAFRRDEELSVESDVRGQRGAYLISTHVSLAPGDQETWSIVGDVEKDAAEVVELRALLAHPAELRRTLDTDIRASRVELERIVATADGLQSSADELATAHHLANVLFNVMRGGVPARGYRVEVHDLRSFLTERSPASTERFLPFLAELPVHLDIDDLVDRAWATGDVDLMRLALEYLPLTFSRRHGDPSRPWNTFQIALRDSDGRPQLNFQGNWRDIFQNWEALSWSYPEYVESMVTVFLNATTADGYNPYRISRAGIDWEVPEPDNPWANIGYWSDHQIVYLLRLLEASACFHPGRLQRLLDVAIFTHADVPYRIASYAETLRDPRATVTFDEGHADLIAARVAELGADGRLVRGPDGGLLRVSMAEKLLLLLLAKLVNLVPDGGIWMNTQRPEWNDANNALVGLGLSVVTLAQVHRYLEFVQALLTTDVHLTTEVADLLSAVSTVLDSHAQGLEQGFTDESRRAFMDAMGVVGTAYRDQVYSGFSGRSCVVSADRIQSLLASAQAYVVASLRSNARPDTLYHSYNTLDLVSGEAGIRHLPVMLEGQVAMLASGLLSAEESLALLTALRASALYRPDQHSYVLYPDKDLPGFLHRNTFSSIRAEQCPLVGELIEAGDRSVVIRDVHGNLHFASGIRNARDVEAALDRIAADSSFSATVDASRGELLDIFEEVFNHAEFTGRSGSFFAYEGLGSIYWHMVSKLLLAIQETLDRATRADEPTSIVSALQEAYEDVRAGLGYCKPPEVYGAFPTDPYSHTPGGHGARQPGMTGQVKEEVLTRLGELGLRVDHGAIVFRPLQLRHSEWITSASTFEYVDVRGHATSLDLPEGSLAFTFCQVPVVYLQGSRLEVRVLLQDGALVEGVGGRIDADLSGRIFRRLGEVNRIEVHVPCV